MVEHRGSPLHAVVYAPDSTRITSLQDETDTRRGNADAPRLVYKRKAPATEREKRPRAAVHAVDTRYFPSCYTGAQARCTHNGIGAF